MPEIQPLPSYHSLTIKDFLQTNFYQRLGLEEFMFAEQSELDHVLKLAYRKACLYYHPDKRDNEDKAKRIFVALHEAYETLIDKKKRQRYDRKRCNPQLNSSHSNTARPASHANSMGQFFKQAYDKKKNRHDDPTSIQSLWTPIEWASFSEEHLCMALKIEALLRDEHETISNPTSQSNARFKNLRNFNLLHFALHRNQYITLRDIRVMNGTLFDPILRIPESHAKLLAEELDKQHCVGFTELLMRIPSNWWGKYPGVIIQTAQRKNSITDFRHLCDRELRYFDDPKFRLLMNKAILSIPKLGELSRNQIELFYQNADHLCAIAWPDLQKMLQLPDIKLSKLLQANTLLFLLRDKIITIAQILNVPEHELEIWITYSHQLGSFVPGQFAQQLTRFIHEQPATDMVKLIFYLARLSTTVQPFIDMAIKIFYDVYIIKNLFTLNAEGNYLLNLHDDLNHVLSQYSQKIFLIDDTALINRFINELFSAIKRTILDSTWDCEGRCKNILLPGNKWIRLPSTISDIWSMLAKLKSASLSANDIVELSNKALSAEKDLKLAPRERLFYSAIGALKEISLQMKMLEDLRSGSWNMRR